MIGKLAGPLTLKDCDLQYRDPVAAAVMSSQSIFICAVFPAAECTELRKADKY